MHKNRLGSGSPDRQNADARRTKFPTAFPAAFPTALLTHTAMACAMLSVSYAAHGMELDTGNSDVTVRFDNTLKASTMVRTRDADPALAQSFNAQGAPQALNFNAGDQNFSKRGFVSERVDLLSEFDAVYKGNVGLRISAAGWYDQAYHRSTDAPNDPLNGQSPYNQFADRTRELSGQKAELMDAFVFGKTTLADGSKLSARLGQHTLLYGESLFFGDNAIAAAQGPVDISKLMSSPNAQFKEIAMPVPQLSAQWQMSPNFSLGGYLQFRWKESRIPAAGSYFSSANIPWGASGPEYISIPAFVPMVGGNYRAQPGADDKPSNGGQFGLQAKWRLDETDLGFYYARYHDKTGQLYGRLNPAAPATDSRWFYKFGSDIDVAGISVSQSVGDFNLSAEGSIRDNMPLNVDNMIYFGPSAARQPTNPTGRTAHLNLSSLASFGPNFIARESSVVAEIAWNRVLSKNDPDGEIDGGRTRDASILQFVYTPTYRQLFDGVDISVPLGVRYSLSGRSSVTAWGAKGTGSANIGIEGNVRNSWQFGLNYTRYIGSSVPFHDYNTGQLGAGNALGDRDFVSLNVRRTF